MASCFILVVRENGCSPRLRRTCPRQSSLAYSCAVTPCGRGMHSHQKSFDNELVMNRSVCFELSDCDLYVRMQEFGVIVGARIAQDSLQVARLRRQHPNDAHLAGAPGQTSKLGALGLQNVSAPPGTKRLAPTTGANAYFLFDRSGHGGTSVPESGLPRQSSAAGARQRKLAMPWVAIIEQLLGEEKVDLARRVALASVSFEPHNRGVRSLLALLQPPNITPSQARTVDRRKDFEWIIAHHLEYRGQWVAVHDGTLVAHNRSLQQLLAILAPIDPARTALLHRID